MRVDFEYVDFDTILYKENGRVIKDEELNHESYSIYVNARSPDYKLIPYFKILSGTFGPDKQYFDDDNWNRHVVPRLPSVMNNALFPFQKTAIYKMIKSKRCMNAASPGLGKSIQALACLAYFKNPNGSRSDIIICPSYLRSNWLNEIKTWLPDEISFIIDKAGKKDLDNALNILRSSDVGIKIISYDMFANMMSTLETTSDFLNIFNTVIMDESHFIKDSNTKRYRMIGSVVKSAFQVFLLTGTPAPNRNKELFTQFSFIYPSEFYDYRVFTNRYCDGHMDKFNFYDDRGSSNVCELSYLMSKMVIRMRREDYIEDLPDIFRQKVIVRPKTISKQFMKRKQKFIEELENIDTDENAKFKVQALASEMFRDTAVIKIPPVLEYLSSYVNSMDLEKTIIFCKHQTMVTSVQEFFETNGWSNKYITISGKTDMTIRPELISQFRDPESPIMFALLTVGSCSTGLNITPIRRMLFIELDWSPSTLDQCEARINRIGGSKKLQYTYIICDYSLDEMVFNKLKNKTALTNDVVDGGKRYGDFEFDDNNKKQKIN